MPPLRGVFGRELAIWYPREWEQGIEPSTFSQDPGDMDGNFLSNSSAQELETARSHDTWQDACFVQFVGVDNEDADHIVRCIPDLPGPEGVGYPRVCDEQPRRKP